MKSCRALNGARRDPRGPEMDGLGLPPYNRGMNRPDSLDVDFPPEWDTTDEEEMRITLERLEEFRRTGLGYTLEDVRAWFEALDRDPTSPCPPPRKLR